MKTPLRFMDYKNVVVLTGAGISVASGLPTYRGAGGLWTKDPDAPVPNVENFRKDPNIIWGILGKLKGQISQAKPNAAHLALVEYETHLTESGANFTLITQNVDELHRRAGSKNLLELHGSLFRTICSNKECKQEAFADERSLSKAPPCELCGNPLRPDVVLFGEAIPAYPEHYSKKALRDCDLFLAVGTSGTVTPAADFVRSAKYVGAHTILLNADPPQMESPDFDELILGPAEEELPALLG